VPRPVSSLSRVQTEAQLVVVGLDNFYGFFDTALPLWPSRPVLLR
jgi:hypothetical protein